MSSTNLNVYEGFWVNHLESNIKILKLTVTDSTALIISLLIGLYVLLAADTLWKGVRVLVVPGVYLMVPRHVVRVVNPADANLDLEGGGGSNTSQTADGAHNEADVDVESGNTTEENQEEISLGTIQSDDRDLISANNDETNNATNENDTTPEDAEDNADGESGNLDDADANTPPTVQESYPINLRDYEFSPKNAIEAWLGIETKNPTVRTLKSECSLKVRRSLGISAMTMILITLFLAPIIPWLLTGFGRETPIVRSRHTKNIELLLYADLLEFSSEDSERMAEQRYLQCRREKLTNPEHKECETPFSRTSLPNLYEYNKTCPFKDGACLDDSTFMRLEHKVSARDLDYNSNSKITLHRSLECGPMNLEKYLVPYHSGKVNAVLMFAALEAEVPDSAPYADFIRTLNGPNVFSSVYSGWNGSDDDTTVDRDTSLSVFPDIKTPSSPSKSIRNAIHPSLRVDDGSPFVVLFKAGRIKYADLLRMRVIDPIFSASRIDNQTRGHLPDYEVTGLVCTERFRFCIQPDANTLHVTDCTDWMPYDEQILYSEEETNFKVPNFFKGFFDNETDFRYLNDSLLGQRFGGEFVKNHDLFLLFLNTIRYSSVSRFFRNNSKFLIHDYYRNGGAIQFFDAVEQWKHELRATFQASYLMARGTYFLNVVKDKSACDGQDHGGYGNSYLFYDGSYTNMEVIPFILTLFVLTVPILWRVTAYLLKLYISIMRSQKVQRCRRKVKQAYHRIVVRLLSYCSSVRQSVLTAVQNVYFQIKVIVISMGDLVKQLCRAVFTKRQRTIQPAPDNEN